MLEKLMKIHTSCNITYHLVGLLYKGVGKSWLRWLGWYSNEFGLQLRKQRVGRFLGSVGVNLAVGALNRDCLRDSGIFSCSWLTGNLDCLCYVHSFVKVSYHVASLAGDDLPPRPAKKSLALSWSESMLLGFLESATIEIQMIRWVTCCWWAKCRSWRFIIARGMDEFGMLSVLGWLSINDSCKLSLSLWLMLLTDELGSSDPTTRLEIQAPTGSVSGGRESKVKCQFAASIDCMIKYDLRNEMLNLHASE